MEIAVNGINIAYDWYGPDDGPVLVLINGLLTDRNSWKGHLPFFTDRFRVLAYDCRGQGSSDKPADETYPPRLHAADLLGLLDALGVERAALLGVSSGACIALQFAADHPERVSALISANGYGRADTAMQVKLNGWLSGMKAGGGPLRFDVATPWVWGATYLNEHYEQLKPFREYGSTLPVEVAARLIAGAMDHDALAGLPSITCPTLLLTGDEDVLTPLSYSHEIQRRVAGSRIAMLERAGHCMFLEQVAAFSQAAAAFLHEVLH